MEIKVKGKFIRMSPRKIRLVADLIRGLDVEKAITRLNFSSKDAGKVVLKVLKSAISNAEENHNLRRSNLFVKEIKVDGGPTLDRWMPRAYGRATPIRKRTSHLILTLGELIPTEGKVSGKAAKKSDAGKDVIKVSDYDELKELSAGKKEDQTAENDDKKSKKEKKGFAAKMINRRTGQK